MFLVRNHMCLSSIRHFRRQPSSPAGSIWRRRTSSSTSNGGSKKKEPTTTTTSISKSASDATKNTTTIANQPTTVTSNNTSSLTEDLYIGTHIWRLVCAFGIVYVVTEYGVELTICEGPSMEPTIRPRGEIVLMDRFTPRWHGLQGGTNGAERARLARAMQRRHVEQLKLNHQYSNETNETWHQPMIPVNRLPKEGAYDRLWCRLTSGVSVGDVVVVQHPDRIGTVCKRVLGLPGDVVTKPTFRSKKEMQRLRRRGTGMLVVPDGHIWVEGDNPWNSSDSRNYGSIPAALIVGRVLLRVWPLRGSALMERGARPDRDESQEPQLTFSGSVVLPAGYTHQIIIQDPERPNTQSTE